MLKLKEDGTVTWNQLGQIHAKLGIILFTFYRELVNHNVQDMTITSIIREQTTDSGVHAVGRGIDIRIDFDIILAQQIVDTINAQFPYDVTRPHLPTAYIHDAGSGIHVHLQSM